MYRIKDLLLWVHIVVKTLNFSYHTTPKNCSKVRATYAARLSFLIQIIVMWFLSLLLSLLKLPNEGVMTTYAEINFKEILTCAQAIKKLSH